MSIIGNWMNIFRKVEPNFADNETPTGAIDGTNTVYTLLHTPNPTSGLQVFVNSLRANQGQDYTITGNSITMLYTLQPANVPNGLAADSIVCFYRY